MKIIFIFNEYSLHNHVIEKYILARPQDQISIIKVAMVIKGKDRKETAIKILPQLSKRFIWSKLKEFILILILTLVPKISNQKKDFKRLRFIANNYKLNFLKTDNLMSKNCLEFINTQQADLIICLAHQIIKKELIDLVKIGVINIHPGILPEFRGIQPYFWELMLNHGSAGASFHWIEDATIDTGKILAIVKYQTWPKMSVQLNYFLTMQSVAKTLPELITAVELDRIEAKDQNLELGNYYRWPDSASVDQLLKQGNKIVDWRDLLKIIFGAYEDFSPSYKKIYFKN